MRVALSQAAASGVYKANLSQTMCSRGHCHGHSVSGSVGNRQARLGPLLALPAWTRLDTWPPCLTCSAWLGLCGGWGEVDVRLTCPCVFTMRVRTRCAVARAPLADAACTCRWMTRHGVSQGRLSQQQVLQALQQRWCRPTSLPLAEARGGRQHRASSRARPPQVLL